MKQGGVVASGLLFTGSPRRWMPWRAAAILWLLGLVGGAGAIDRVWNSAGDGIWTNTARWSPAASPGSGDRAIFNTNGQNGAETVYLAGNQSIAALIFTNTGTTTLLGGLSGAPATNTLALSINGSILSSPGAGAVTIGAPNAPVSLLLWASTQSIANQLFENDSSSLFTVSNAITCSGNANFQSATLYLAGPGDMTFAGPVTNNGSASITMIKNGSGTLTLGGSNSYTGATTINAGVLALNGNLGATALSVNSATLNQGSGSVVTGTASFAIGGSTATLNGSNAYTGATIINNSGVTLNGILGSTAISLWPGATLTQSAASRIGGTASLVVTNGATASLAGSNTYSGATLINGGALTLSGANAATGTTAVSGGTLTLNYASQNNSKLSDTATLTLGGGTVVLAGGSHTETVSNTVLNSGASIITQATGSAVLQMRAVTRNAASALNLASSGIAQIDTPLLNGILGAYATVGGVGAADWASTAAASGANRAVQPLATYASFASTAATSNTLLTGGGALASSRTNNTLKITTTDSGQALDLGGALLTLGGGGLLFAGSSDYAINNGLIRSTTNNPSELIIQQWGTGKLTINAVITNGTGNSILTKGGAGTLVLGTSNTYSGTTYIQQGTLLPGAANVFNSGSAVVLTGGSTLDLSASCPPVGSLAGTLSGAGGTVSLGGNTLVLGGAGTAITDFGGSLTGSGGITKVGISTQRLSGVSTYTGVTTLNQGTLSVVRFSNNNAAGGLGCGTGSAGDLVFGGGTLRFDATTGGYDTNTGIARTDRLFTIGNANGNTAILDASGNNSFDGWNALQFTGTGAIAFGTAAAHTLILTGAHTGLSGSDLSTRSTVRASAFAPSLIDDVSGDPTYLIKSGAGVWNLTGSSTFSGGTDITGGRLVVSSTNALGTGAVTVENGGSLALVMAGTCTNAVLLAGTGPSLNPFGTANGSLGALILGNGAVLAGPVTLTANARVSAANIYADVAQTGTISGVISGSSTLELSSGGANPGGSIVISNPSNSFTGGITISAGGTGSTSLMLAFLGASEVIPNGPGKGNVVLNGLMTGGSVQFFLGGFSETINGLVSAGSNCTMLVQNGSASTPSMLTLGDADTTACFTGTVQNGSTATLALTKIGAGTQTLAGPNTYGGQTIVNSGTLLVSSSLTATASILVNATGTFAYASPLTLSRIVTNAGGTFRYSSGSNYTGTLVWNAGRLAGTNWNGPKLSGLSIGAGRTIAPGDGLGSAVTASQTWSSAGCCEIALSNATATAGTGWSWLSVAGALDLSTLSPAAPFVVKITTQDATGAAGVAPGFNAHQPCTLPIVGFGSLNGSFSSSLFTVDTSSVSNALAGNFKVIQSGSTLALQYTLCTGTTILLR